MPVILLMMLAGFDAAAFRLNWIAGVLCITAEIVLAVAAFMEF